MNKTRLIIPDTELAMSNVRHEIYAKEEMLFGDSPEEQAKLLFTALKDYLTTEYGTNASMSDLRKLYRYTKFLGKMLPTISYDAIKEELIYNYVRKKAVEDLYKDIKKDEILTLELGEQGESKEESIKLIKENSSSLKKIVVNYKTHMLPLEEDTVDNYLDK